MVNGVGIMCGAEREREGKEAKSIFFLCHKETWGDVR